MNSTSRWRRGGRGPPERPPSTLGFRLPPFAPPAVSPSPRPPELQPDWAGRPPWAKAARNGRTARLRQSVFPKACWGLNRTTSRSGAGATTRSNCLATRRPSQGPPGPRPDFRCALLRQRQGARGPPPGEPPSPRPRALPASRPISIIPGWDPTGAVSTVTAAAGRDFLDANVPGSAAVADDAPDAAAADTFIAGRLRVPLRN